MHSKSTAPRSVIRQTLYPVIRGRRRRYLSSNSTEQKAPDKPTHFVGSTADKYISERAH